MNRRYLEWVTTCILLALILLAVQFVVLKPAKERSKARVCHSHFSAIALYSRMYAAEQGTGFQTNLICLSNYLISPIKLLCVEDDLRSRRVREKATALVGSGSAGHWSKLTMEDCSYEAFLRNSNTLVIRCPIHRIAGYVDGDVSNGSSWIKREKYDN